MNTRSQNVTDVEINLETLTKLLSEQSSAVIHNCCPLEIRSVEKVKSSPCILGKIYCAVSHVSYYIKPCTHFPSSTKLTSFNYSKLAFHSKVCRYYLLAKELQKPCTSIFESRKMKELFWI